MLFQYKGNEPNIEENVYIADSSNIIGDVYISSGASIWYNVVVRGDENQIFIGQNTNVQDLSMIHISKKYPTYIGEDVTIGHKCIIHACEIDDNVLVGMGAIILDGAKIGKNSIIGAGALVTKDKVFPENSLILGSPAKLVRELSEDEINSIKKSADEYLQYAKNHMESSREVK